MSAIEEMITNLIREGYRVAFWHENAVDLGTGSHYDVFYVTVHDANLTDRQAPISASAGDTLREALSEAYQGTPAR